jgi:hypothetical protein
VIVTLNHRGGTDITPAMGITGFEVFDNSSSVTIQSAARYTTDAVQLTLSRSISSGHTVTLRYLYGMTPNISGLVKDNSSLALPLENTTADLMVLNTYILNVSKSGGGSGTVTSSPAGINCGSTCSYAFNYNTVVTLTASPTSNIYRFVNWGGDAGGSSNPIQITMTQSWSVAAIFEQATFTDVPYDYSEALGGVNYLLYPYIQSLYNGGFTNGCNLSPFMYCPTMILNRGMIAKFLLNVNHGAGYPIPPLPANPVFMTDVWNPDKFGNDGSWARPWAEQLYAEGLTNGCWADPLTYCPWDDLPRIQAAKFGLTMEHGSSYIPPTADGGLLADVTCLPTGVPGDPCWGTPWAEQAYREGLLVACGTQGGKPLFCPNDAMDRAWTAYMIVKAKSLPLP